MNSNVDFKKEIANFVFISRYARYSEKLGRREAWEETCDRVFKMHEKKFFHMLSSGDLEELKWAFEMVKQKRVVPSMRTLQFAGKAIEQNNLRTYNCAVRHIDSLRAFAEVFELLLAGTGVGFGVSKMFLSRFPNLIEPTGLSGSVLTYVIDDTIEGWADSIEVLLMSYFKNTPFSGRRVIFDYSKIRKKGIPLKISGGKAPGSSGLRHTHLKIISLLTHLVEDLKIKRMRSIDAYDIIMHVSDAVLSGGIRRSASICIFDKDDEYMMNAKTYFIAEKIFRFSFDEETKKWYGKVKVSKKTYELELDDYEYRSLNESKKISWFHIEPQRARSNNSVLLERNKVTKKEFEDIIGKTRQFGEPGFIFANDPRTLLNPCCEISFIPITNDNRCGVQMCNLSSINGAKVTSLDEFKECGKAASILGTLQATYTEMDYLNPESKQLTEEEALLGVSITGMMDNPDILLNKDNQKLVAKICIETNKKWSKLLGINQASRITCVKPEGSSSLVLESASGIHPHHARRYFRRVQCNKLDPVYRFFKKHNPHMIEDSLWSSTKTDGVITFPIQVSDKAIVKRDLTALKHLEYIKDTQANWVNSGTTESNNKDVRHSVSCTVIAKDDEWVGIIDYLFKNKEYFSAVSFVPALSDKVYKQAPMEEVTTEEDEKKWSDLVTNFKHINWKDLKEEDDQTNLMKEVACSGGACELV